jgi:hypothetical protein
MSRDALARILDMLLWYLNEELERRRALTSEQRDMSESKAEEIAHLVRVNADLLAALKSSLAGHYATWMAARAEVEGGRTSHALFEKEPDVIMARAAIAKATGQGDGV